MKNKFSTILAVLVIALLTISTADAGGGIKISNSTFSLGSLITDGFVTGTGQSTITVVLSAQGTCTIDGESVPVFATGSQTLFGNKESETENHKRPFHVETSFQDPSNCSNDPDLEDGFVFWTQASISVFSGFLCGEFCEGLQSSAFETDNTLLVTQDYNCTTNQDANTVSCKPTKNHGSNNGAVAICHATGSTKNPYVLMTAKVNGLNGHGHHAGDIIPAPAGGCP